MCEKLLSQIELAGAGAGKTYSIASKILDRCNQKMSSKMIYAITYTNYAKANIIERIKEQNNGDIPSDIVVETVHSFLLNELIYPFSKYYFGYSFSKAVSISLSNKQALKGFQINRLNDRGIIHNSQVFNKAKQMVVAGKGTTKKICSQKAVIMDYMVSSIDSLFIDEAQDLDEDALNLFGTMGMSLFVYMVGDPKQAIKYPGAFRTFCDKISINGSNFILLPINTATRRVPESHLQISNLFCPENEKQYNMYKVQGMVCYIYSSDDLFLLLHKSYKNKKALIYTQKKSIDFTTNNGNRYFSLEESVREKLIEVMDERFDKDAYIKAIECQLLKIAAEKGSMKAINFLKNSFKVQIENCEFARMAEDLKIEANDKKIEVESIDKVKGLENDYCMFIINNSLLEYLFEKRMEVNKQSMYLYVALTRSKKDLILVVDETDIKNKCRKDIDEGFKKLGITYINEGYLKDMLTS
jgi:superfamily I DNA/RNA helicase